MLLEETGVNWPSRLGSMLIDVINFFLNNYCLYLMQSRHVLMQQFQNSMMPVIIKKTSSDLEFYCDESICLKQNEQDVKM